MIVKEKKLVAPAIKLVTDQAKKEVIKAAQQLVLATPSPSVSSLGDLYSTEEERKLLQHSTQLLQNKHWPHLGRMTKEPGLGGAWLK